jgi:hypothetical protein
VAHRGLTAVTRHDLDETGADIPHPHQAMSTADGILDLIAPGAEAGEMLRALAREIARTMRPDIVPYWLDRPLPALAGETPRAWIGAGRADELRQVLLAFNVGFTG